MNDNVAPLTRLEQRDALTMQDGDVALMRAVATRAIAKPESLTMGEIQEVGWAFLMASKQLARGARQR